MLLAAKGIKMADSISIRVDISGLNINNQQQEALPHKRKTITNQFGVILRSDRLCCTNRVYRLLGDRFVTNEP